MKPQFLLENRGVSHSIMKNLEMNISNNYFKLKIDYRTDKMKKKPNSSEKRNKRAQDLFI